MPANSTDYFTKVGSPGTATTLAAPGHTIGGTSFTVVSTTNWSTDTGIIFAIDTFTTQTVNGVATAVRTPGSYTEWEGVVSSSTSLTSAVLRYGTDQNYPAGANTRVYIPVASSRENRIVDGLLAAGITQSGGMGAIAPTSITTSGNVTIGGSLTIGSAGTNGWSPITGSITSVTANGNRSYTCATSADNSGFISPGMRLRTTRTVPAPTQCTNLNGTNQYYSKTSPAGMTFTNNFVVDVAIKPSSYTVGMIATRFDGTNGWAMFMNSDGTMILRAYNGSGSNYTQVSTYQSVALNKWTRVTMKLDMTSTTTTGGTNSYVMFDGVEVPATISRSGTNPTSLVQGGNLNIGSWQNGVGNFFPGKIAQLAIFGTHVTEATMLGYISQGYSGTETSLVSAYSFNNSINDLNTTNANNLTANGSVVATNADSPFGGQGDGTISSTLDYAIVQKVTSTTLTVQVPEGCTIPTSGGVSAVSYSTYKVPFGFPGQKDKWRIKYLMRAPTTLGSAPTVNTWYNSGGVGSPQLYVPIGEYDISYSVSVYMFRLSATSTDAQATLSTSNNSETDTELTSRNLMEAPSGTLDIRTSMARMKGISNTSATTYFLNVRTTSGSGDIGIDTTIPALIIAENAYL